MGYKTKPLPGLLILLCTVPNILCICPLKCSCSARNRNVDCSNTNLTALPHGLQDNLIHLNLSHNHFTNLDHQLTRFVNLRSLDLSHNLLKNLPSHLPRSLWAVYASENHIKALHKLDTAYQWNLKVLDVSRNRLQRTVFINNTLTSLQLLNLSHNQLWTVPTNMPSKVRIVDLSNNYLIQILPGTLVRLHNLQELYLHNNRFTYIPDKAFDYITHLQEITLYNNPWSCKETQVILYLLTWVREIAQNVIGCPCVNETSQLSTATASSGTVDYKSLFTTTSLMFLEAKEKKYKPVPVSEAVTFAPLITTGTSTDNLFLPDEGSADEFNSLDYSTFSTRDVLLIKSDELEYIEVYDPPVTFINRKRATNTMPSTTLPTLVHGTTIKIKNGVPSSAHKHTGLVCILPLLLLLRTV
ncbi:oligodendrocyte-myelin glycoprotein [Pelodytes ibericus]